MEEYYYLHFEKKHSWKKGDFKLLTLIKEGKKGYKNGLPGELLGLSKSINFYNEIYIVISKFFGIKRCTPFLRESDAKKYIKENFDIDPKCLNRKIKFDNNWVILCQYKNKSAKIYKSNIKHSSNYKHAHNPYDLTAIEI